MSGPKAAVSIGGRIQRSVSIPKELDLRMKQHPDMNWSVIAVSAFESHLLKLEEGAPSLEERVAVLEDQVNQLMKGKRHAHP